MCSVMHLHTLSIGSRSCTCSLLSRGVSAPHPPPKASSPLALVARREKRRAALQAGMGAFVLTREEAKEKERQADMRFWQNESRRQRERLLSWREWAAEEGVLTR